MVITVYVVCAPSEDKLQDSIGLDLPKIVGFLQGKKWEVKNQAKQVEQMSLPEIL